MRPARSSATKSCRSAIMRRSRRRLRPGRARGAVTALWTTKAIEAATRRRRPGRCRRRSPAFRSTAAPSVRARPISPSRAMSMTAMISSPPRSRPARRSRWSPATAWRPQRDRSMRRSSLVDDVLAALRDLAARRAGALDARIVAVTGSVGKTSTKEALALALAPTARPTLRPPRSTITGAFRCRSRGSRSRRATPCSRSA